MQFVINRLRKASGKCFSLSIPLNTTSWLVFFSFKILNKARLKEFVLISSRFRKRHFGVALSDLKYMLAANKTGGGQLWLNGLSKTVCGDWGADILFWRIQVGKMSTLYLALALTFEERKKAEVASVSYDYSNQNTKLRSPKEMICITLHTKTIAKL